MLFKTKMFSSYFVLEKNENKEWILSDKTEDLDDQINNWVDFTGNVIVNTSAPTMHADWIDGDNNKKKIYLYVVVIYKPEEYSDVRGYPEFRAPAS